MMKPKLQSATSPTQFKEAIAGYAFELHRWIELNVEAFSSDPRAREERRKQAQKEKTGFWFFVETYLPHYVKGVPSLFHEAVFARVPQILKSEKGAREIFMAHRGSSKSTHLSLGFVIYCIVMERKHYIVEVSDVYSQAVLLILDDLENDENVRTPEQRNPKLLHFGAIALQKEPKEPDQRLKHCDRRCQARYYHSVFLQNLATDG